VTDLRRPETDAFPSHARADDDLGAAVSSLVADAAGDALDRGTREELEEARRRLTGPLRLAFAGRVKAGKSTLLNALVGEELAPTDASECTKVVTWYVGSDHPEVLLHARDGTVSPRPYRRESGPVDVDLGRPLDEVDYLEIRWPSARLHSLTLIDTPGLASLSAGISRRAEVLLPSRAETDGAGPRRSARAPAADAVLYLLRHAHSADMRFLEAFADAEFAVATASNALGILSRADEIGSCRLDALDVAARIARRYEEHPRVHRVCPAVLPVAGLLAQAGVTLREAEFRLLARVAALPAERTRLLLLSTDRFTADDHDVEVTPLERSHLLDRLGLFGVRHAVDALQRGQVSSAHQLALSFVQLSGLDRLRRLVLTQFGQRARLLTSRSAVLTLRAAIARGGVARPQVYEARLEELLATAHAFVEIRLLDDVRSGALEVSEVRAAALERLFGGSGAATWARLGLPETATFEEVRAAALAELTRWQRVAESPLTSRALALAARTAVRTCEAMLGS
jgi:hypothetical protein